MITHILDQMYFNYKNAEHSATHHEQMFRLPMYHSYFILNVHKGLLSATRHMNTHPTDSESQNKPKKFKILTGLQLLYP
jgi:hypothetical protein